ncbi:MAG: cytochrome c biogenesis protein CcsA [Clostridia bacterium]|nr:cytochrome c biogenesis protein CcsA [Clostridia bacterium]
MLNTLFTISVGLYFIATLLQFGFSAFKKNWLKKAAWVGLIAAAATHTAYLVARGIAGGRLPMANQFEFACCFAWGIAVMGIFFKLFSKRDMDWVAAVSTPMAFLIISYAALQPQEITELMPALRSAWFSLHIGAAVFSYAAFAIAACVGVRYVAIERKSDEGTLRHTDNFSYKLICFGFLMLSVVILSGCVWAEQAWSSFWSWDPKETWALITWIIYAIYLHQRLRMKWRGHKMAWFAIIAFIAVLFTFVGVNKLLPGLHSYA